MKIQIVSLLLTGAVLAGGGYTLGRLFAPQVIVPAPVGKPVTQTVRVGHDASAIELSRALSEIAALKTEKAELQKAYDALLAQKTEEETPVEEPRRMTMRERMEEFKRTDPEGYKQEMERRKEFVNSMREAHTARENFLRDIDVSLLSSEEQETHARYLEAMEKRAQFDERMHELIETGERPSDEDITNIREAYQTLHQLRDAERQALLGAIGTSMGLSRTDAADFTALVQDVIESTGGHVIMGGPMMHGGRGRGRPQQQTAP